MCSLQQVMMKCFYEIFKRNQNHKHRPSQRTYRGKNSNFECKFTNVSAILCKETPVEEIKAILRSTSSTGAMFLVGGAMMQGFPDLMAEILSFIEKECHFILVVKTTKADFDEGISWPPTEQDVNKSALNICNRLLPQGKEW